MPIAAQLSNAFISPQIEANFLATAKAVLPEIVGEVFSEAVAVCDEMDGWRTWAKVPGFGGAPTEADAAANYLSEKIRALGDRRLEELK